MGETTSSAIKTGNSRTHCKLFIELITSYLRKVIAAVVEKQ